MKKFLWTLFVLLLVGVGFLALIKNPQSNISQKILPMIGLEKLVTEPTTTIANPASIFCEQNSGTLEIITDLSGGQSGLCHLPDGNTCDEWAYMRGECPTTGGNTTGELSSTLPQAMGIEPTEFSYTPQNDVTVQKTNVNQYLSDFFTAEERINTINNCYTDKKYTKRSLQYFTDLLAKFENDKVIEYNFVYTDKQPTQRDIDLNGTNDLGWKVYILPNRNGYKSIYEFDQDFGECGVGGLVPTLISENYILFMNGCGSGGGEPFGCTDIQNRIQKTIILQ